MFRLKGSSLLLAALLSAGTASLATAAPGDMPQSAGNTTPAVTQKALSPRLGALIDSWQLDASQRTALEQAYQDYRDQRRALRKQYANLRASHETRLAEILDTDQLEALHAMQRSGQRHADHAGHQRSHKPGEHDRQPGPGKPPAQANELIDTLYTSWGLSNAQRTDLATARERFMADASALREESFESRDARRKAFAALRDRHRETMGKILSAEQLAVLDQLLASRFRHGTPPSRH
ncbi:MAG: hypothetical protein UMU75_02380 [Halomonas sp.]|nr:hypothetical protein [Halomonas sp.]